ncbi:sigma-54-dependent Fis family transcriptional regulator [Nocardia vaccinii]|uniref:sigma-54-dependent Fis family transcriptional regulator n=1 Tax=Nocardia vaccinii TaxID=1822 RepID=UPI00083421A1|nr:helix-turn-helix domain-containing protein [Nocardia vaccinii]
MSELVVPGTASTRSAQAIAVRPTRASLTELRGLRERFLADPVNTDISGVRDVIARSWRRSLVCQVDPESVRTEVRENRLDAPFLEIATPILDRLDDMARHTGACLFLSDATGTHAIRRGDRDVLRWADARAAVVGGYVAEELTGTNSDGTALEEGVSVQVWGPEHYAEALQETFCTSAPIMDPLRNRIMAVITMMVPEKVALNTAPGALAFPVEWAAAEISRQVMDRLAYREQALLRAYMHESRLRGGDAVVAIDERTTIASTRAKQMLTTSDYAVLSGYAREAQSYDGTVEQVLSLSDSKSVSMTAKPVTAYGRIVGAVVRLREIRETNDGSKPVPLSRNAFPALIGESAVVVKLRSDAAAALRHIAPVCITGERGTGRAHLARLMAEVKFGAIRVVECDFHRSDALDGFAAAIESAVEKKQPIVALHIDELSPDIIETAREPLSTAASRGMLFVTAYQVTEGLLDVLSTTAPLEVRMPALRLRRDDIPLLVSHFLARDVHGPAPVASGKLLHALTNAEWPGNISELRDVVLTAGDRNRSGLICVTDLAEAHRASVAHGRLSRLEAAELEQIRHALAESHGNRARAAELLEIGRSTLYRKIDLYERRGYDLGR